MPAPDTAARRCLYGRGCVHFGSMMARGSRGGCRFEGPTSLSSPFPGHSCVAHGCEVAAGEVRGERFCLVPFLCCRRLASRSFWHCNTFLHSLSFSLCGASLSESLRPRTWLIDSQAEQGVQVALRPSVSRCSTLRAIRAMPVDSQSFHGAVCLGPRPGAWSVGVCRAESARSRVDALASRGLQLSVSFSLLKLLLRASVPLKPADSTPARCPTPSAPDRCTRSCTLSPSRRSRTTSSAGSPARRPSRPPRMSHSQSRSTSPSSLAVRTSWPTDPRTVSAQTPQTSSFPLFFPKPNSTRRRVGVRAAPRCAGTLAHCASRTAWQEFMMV